MARVTVVGGGLAGMVAALRLAENGLSVSIVEASQRLGGKAGADRGPWGFDEHGYHIFPPWYLNTRALLRELGISGDLVDLDAAFWLRPGSFPDFRSLKSPASVASLFSNLLSGVMRPEDLLIFYVACLDLAAQPPRRHATLDQFSLTGFPRSRPYATDRLARSFHDAVLKSVSAPGFQVSAMTLKRVVSFWMRYPTPLSSVFKGNLQTCFIEPFARRLLALGCDVRLETEVTRISVDGRRITSLETSGPPGAGLATSDYYVLAVPAERLAALLDDGLYRAAPRLAEVKYVRTAPMAALNLYLPRKVTGIPVGHVSLVGSQYGLSFIDVSALWPEQSVTVINAIASDVSNIAGLSLDRQRQLLVEDLARFLPFVTDPGVHCVFKPNDRAPLFMSSVGVWHHRPVANIGLENAAVAGDFVRTPVDLASMEAAIMAGHDAASSVADALGIAPLPLLRAPSIVPAWLLRPVFFAALPAAILCRLISRVRGGTETNG